MRAAIFMLFLVAGVPTQADTIAIIGTGNVGGALGPEFAAQGHTIVYGSRDPQSSNVAELVIQTGNGASATTQAEAAAQADIVVLAVPGMLAEGMSLEAIDLGGIENAHWVEGMLILWINNRYFSERPAFEYHLRKAD